MTPAIVIAVIVVCAVVVGAITGVIDFAKLRRPTRLERELTAAALTDAMRRVSDEDMEALADATREAPQRTDEEIDRLREVMRKDGEGP